MNFYSEKNSLLPPKFIFRERSTLVPYRFLGQKVLEKEAAGTI